MSEHKFPTEVIDLPSQGKVYSKDSPLTDGKVELKFYDEGPQYRERETFDDVVGGVRELEIDSKSTVGSAYKGDIICINPPVPLLPSIKGLYLVAILNFLTFVKEGIRVQTNK